MGRFEFRNLEIQLDIAGVKAFVPGTAAFADRLRQIGEEMVSFGETMESAEQAEEYMLDILDELVGKEAMDQIEEKRKLDIYDCCDLFRYITDEVKDYHAEKAAAYRPAAQTVPQPVPMAKAATENRAARRARARAEKRK